jgi:hypothetical protein
LLAQVRAGIDLYVHGPGIRLGDYVRGASQPAVARIIRPTDAALAPDDRHACGRTGPQQRHSEARHGSAHVAGIHVGRLDRSLQEPLESIAYGRAQIDLVRGKVAKCGYERHQVRLWRVLPVEHDHGRTLDRTMSPPEWTSLTSDADAELLHGRLERLYELLRLHGTAGSAVRIESPGEVLAGLLVARGE